jgi:hypothetical protein
LEAGSAPGRRKLKEFWLEASMANETPGTGLSISKLVLVPALVTLAITILRLVGELQHWPSSLFNRSSGGGGAIIGITWLAPVFGIYFAFKLVRAGGTPASLGRAIGMAILGAVIIVATSMVGGKFLSAYGFKAVLIFFWFTWALAGLLQFIGWPGFFKILVAYSLAARIPVAILMFFAFWGHWGTHYDALPTGWQSGGLWSDYLWMGFFPQLLLWVGYTVAAGALFGSITAGVMRLFWGSNKAAVA